MGGALYLYFKGCTWLLQDIFRVRQALHHVRDFVPSWAVWRGRGCIGPEGKGRLPRAYNADLGRN
nr:MAG TPA: hypothetical protein [Caudoviricetes sp.]